MAEPLGRSADGDDELVRRVLRGSLAVIPLIGWLVFVLLSGLAPHDQETPPDIPEALRLVGAASGTALAAIAGAFLGIKPLEISFAAAVRLPNLTLNAWASIAYFLGLVVALVVWAVDPNRGYAADVVQTALATLFGFGVGALKAATTSST